MRTNTAGTSLAVSLADLRERLAAIDHRGNSARPVQTGWPDIDGAFQHGGLQRNAVHEWIGLESLPGLPATARWSPPLTVLVHLASRVMEAASSADEIVHVCWIGACVWPSVPALTSGGVRTELLARSLFVDAGDVSARLWATDLALRTRSVLVIADGSGFDMASSRRLQLAAESKCGEGGWLAHLARPPWEAKELSAAMTRWGVARAKSEGDEPCFSVRLLRGKGMRSALAPERLFHLQRESCDRLVAVHPEHGHRPGAEAERRQGERADPALERRASA